MLEQKMGRLSVLVPNDPLALTSELYLKSVRFPCCCEYLIHLLVCFHKTSEIELSACVDLFLILK